MAKSLDPEVMAMVLHDWSHAAPNNKTLTIDGWAGRLGLSSATLYRHLPRQRTRAAERKIDGIEAAARVVASIKCRPPEHRGRITTEQAVRIAVGNGLIERRFADHPASTFDRVIRETGDLNQARRISRFQAERPNEMHHVDASTSNAFYIARRLPDGDFVLKLHKGTKDYKNKPIPVDGLRPWYYGLADDNSGVTVARLIAAQGESAGDNMDFLSWAWSKNPDKEFFGMCDTLKGDMGVMMRSDMAPEWFGRLGVEIDKSKPLGKEAHGKIERPWRTLWQRFELPFFAEDMKAFEINLHELNRRLYIYLDELNSRPHRFERGISRIDAWRKINLHGGAVELPENAIRTVVRRWARKIDQAGVFSLDGVLYEVKGLHDAWAWIYQGVFEEKMVVVEKATGRTFEVENFVPNKIGEYSASPDTPRQTAMKDAAEMQGLRNTLYVEKAAEAANIKRLPTRTKAPRALVNPLAADTYHTIAEALADFQSQCGIFLSKENREAVTTMIVENGLSRKFVRDLASEVQTASLHAQHG